MNRYRNLTIALFCAISMLAIGTAAQATTSTVPPGNGEADQYSETIPGANGNEVPDGSRDPEDVLPSSQVDDLQGSGPDGAGVAALAAATAPAVSGEPSGTGGGSGANGDDPRASAGSGAPDDVVATAQVAAPSDDGLGSALWVVVIAAAIGALAFAFARRVRHGR